MARFVDVFASFVSGDIKIMEFSCWTVIRAPESKEALPKNSFPECIIGDIKGDLTGYEWFQPLENIKFCFNAAFEFCYFKARSVQESRLFFEYVVQFSKWFNCDGFKVEVLCVICKDNW